MAALALASIAHSRIAESELGRSPPLKSIPNHGALAYCCKFLGERGRVLDGRQTRGS
jgi:hypothetical protein